MEGKLQRRIQRYGWDKAAGSYEQYWQRQLAPAQTRLLEMAALQPGGKVLEVACGTGLVTFRLAEAVGSDGEVLATDISEEMIALAREEAAKRGLSYITFERRDAEDLGAPEASFDAALCALGLMYVPDPVVALQEMNRALTKGGRGVVAVWGERRRCGWADIFPIVDARVHSEVCPMFFQLGSGDVLKRSFEAAGFEDVVSERIEVTLHYGSPEEACGAAFAGGPVALAYSRFEQHVREEAHAEYLASIEPYRIGDGYEIPGEFVITSGRNGGTHQRTQTHNRR